MRIVKVPPQIADLRREVLAATTVVSCPVFAPVINSCKPPDLPLLFKEISQEHAAPSHNRLLARHADVQI